MGLLIAAVVVIAAAIGTAKHEGVLEKGADTTYRDTVAFEQHAADMTAQYHQEKADRLEAEMKSWETSPSDSAEPEKKDSTPTNTGV